MIDYFDHPGTDWFTPKSKLGESSTITEFGREHSNDPKRVSNRSLRSIKTSSYPTDSSKTGYISKSSVSTISLQRLRRVRHSLTRKLEQKGGRESQTRPKSYRTSEGNPTLET